MHRSFTAKTTKLTATCIVRCFLAANSCTLHRSDLSSRWTGLRLAVWSGVLWFENGCHKKTTVHNGNSNSKNCCHVVGAVNF